MSVQELIRTGLAILLLGMGIMMFRYSAKIKEHQDCFASHICYAGFLLFLGGAQIAYISDLRISLGILGVLIMLGLGLLFIGKRKQRNKTLGIHT